MLPKEMAQASAKKTNRKQPVFEHEHPEERGRERETRWMNIRYDIKDSLLTLAIIVSYFEETTQATTKKQITKTTTQEHTSSLVDVMRLLLYMYTIYKHRVHQYDRRPAHFNIGYSLRDICVRVNWQTERGKKQWIWLYGTCKRNDIEEFDFDGDFHLPMQKDRMNVYNVWCKSEMSGRAPEKTRSRQRYTSYWCCVGFYLMSMRWLILKLPSAFLRVRKFIQRMRAFLNIMTKLERRKTDSGSSESMMNRSRANQNRNTAVTDEKSI